MLALSDFAASGRLLPTVCRQMSAAFSSGALLPSCNSAVRASEPATREARRFFPQGFLAAAEDDGNRLMW
jgi:hypothetical protein